mgnify:CR=1 FL=1
MFFIAYKQVKIVLLEILSLLVLIEMASVGGIIIEFLKKFLG